MAKAASSNAPSPTLLAPPVANPACPRCATIVTASPTMFICPKCDLRVARELPFSEPPDYDEVEEAEADEDNPDDRP